MQLNTGKVKFLIEFDNGEKRNIYFNPCDPDLMVRMKNLENKIWEKVEKIDDIELDVEGKPIEEQKIELFEKIENAFKEELNYAFGGNVYDTVFEFCSPFAIVNGEYFIIQFMDAIVPEIQKHIENSKNESEKRIAKHIEKYKK